MRRSQTAATAATAPPHRRRRSKFFLKNEASRHGLPIGNLTSQFFANIHLDGFDHFVKQELRVQGYVRYVDDFLIFAESREQARAWGREAREFLRRLRLEIHPDKYRLCRTDQEGADFCGFVCYSSGRIKVRGASVRRYVKRLEQDKRDGCGRRSESRMIWAV